MARTKDGVPSGAEEEYLAEARRRLRNMAGNIDLPDDWGQRLRQYHRDGRPVREALDHLMEEAGFFEDD